VVGIAVGSNLDQQAAKENRQLNIDLWDFLFFF
jgi:hypothetical protein